LTRNKEKKEKKETKAATGMEMKKAL